MSLAHSLEHQLTLVHPVRQSIGGSVRIVNCSPLRISVEYQLRKYLASKHIKPNTIRPQPHPTRMSPSVPKSGSQILTLHRLGNPANRSPIGNPIPHPQNVEMVQQKRHAKPLPRTYAIAQIPGANAPTLRIGSESEPHWFCINVSEGGILFDDGPYKEVDWDMIIQT